MNIKDLQAEINAIYQESAQIEKSMESDIIKRLLNLIEQVASENKSLETEIQDLRDEVNRLKGEQGKPDIKPNKKTVSPLIFHLRKNVKKQRRMLMKTPRAIRKNALDSRSVQKLK